MTKKQFRRKLDRKIRRISEQAATACGHEGELHVLWDRERDLLNWITEEIERLGGFSR